MEDESPEDFEIVDDADVAAAKIQKLKKDFALCRREKEEYLAGWQRSKADSINAERAFSNRLAAASIQAETVLIKEFLEVIDGFEAALEATNVQGSDAPWIDGLKRIHANCLNILKHHGVEPIEAEGKIFDPAYHEAIEIEDAEKESHDHRIVKELQKGYMTRERVLRPARVKVAQYKPK